MKSTFQLLALMAIAVAACSAPDRGKVAISDVQRTMEPGVAEPVMEAFAEANNAFALDLYGRLSGRAENLVFSPHSLSTALAMTYAGARGATEAQMAAAMHYALPQPQLHPAFNQLDLSLKSQSAAASGEEKPLELRIANALWIEQTLPVLSSYLDQLAANYGAGARLADFITAYEPARREINAWVSEQTERRIRDLIPEGALDGSTRMVLVNAIYFYGDWLYQFEADDTRPVPFHRLDGTQVEAPTMHAFNSGISYVDGDGFQIVELPYQGGTAVMDIIVPDQGEFASIESELDGDKISVMLASLQPAALELGLPKFSFGASFDLGEQLAALGMPDAFDRDLADFSGMTGARDLYISKVLHQAFVAVDEKGTEAAAATAVIMGPTSAPMPQAQLIVDRPFVFAIRDLASGQILFLGRVLDPTR